MRETVLCAQSVIWINIITILDFDARTIIYTLSPFYLFRGKIITKCDVTRDSLPRFLRHWKLNFPKMRFSRFALDSWSRQTRYFT